MKFDQDGERAAWWLLSVCVGYSTDACFVGSCGFAGYYGCSNAFRVPVCFSIKK